MLAPQRNSFRRKVGRRLIRTSILYSHRRLEILERVSENPSIQNYELTCLLDVGAVHQIGAPIHIYPLYENGFRAHRNQTIQENNDESAQLYAEFAEVAAKNPQAWQYGKPPASKDFIGTVSKKNRMICFPCKFDFITQTSSSLLQTRYL